MAEKTELSQREQEILYLVASGASNKEIAQSLHISTNTVKVHLRNIFAKIGANSRTEAAMFAVSSGLVDVGMNIEIGEEAANSHFKGEFAGTGGITEGERWQSTRNFWVLSGAIIVVLVIGIIAVILFRNLRGSPVASASQPIVIDIPRWEEKAPLPTARRGLAVAVHNNGIYAISGQTSRGVSGVVERYNPDKDLWESLSQKPVPVTNTNAAVVGGKIYIPGGETSSGELTNILEIYDPSQDRWERGVSLPMPLSSYGLAAYEGKIYLFGGWDGEKAVNSVYEYDPDLDVWVSKTPMPTPRAYPGVGVAEGMIYVFGGFDGEKSLVVNEIYIPDREGSEVSPWEIGEALPQPRYAMGVATLADTLHVIGGVGEGPNTLPSLELLPQSETWEVYQNPFEGQWSQLGLVPLGTHLYLTGGDFNGNPTANNLTYQALFLVNLPVVR